MGTGVKVGSGEGVLVGSGVQVGAAVFVAGEVVVQDMTKIVVDNNAKLPAVRTSLRVLIWSVRIGITFDRSAYDESSVTG